MGYVIAVVGYAIGVVLTALVSQRLVPHLWYGVEEKLGYYSNTRYARPTGAPGEKLAHLPERDSAIVASLAWPVGIVAIAVMWLSETNLRSLNEQRTLRAQMEKDLAAARKEIDELLARDK